MERFCVFDIETAPLAEAETYLPAPKARANLRDPVKIEADLREKTTANLERAALDPDLCRIVAAAWDCDGQAESAVCADDEQERLLLERFWRQSQGATLVGFNCLGFDLPVLLRRSLYLGVRAPLLTLNKYRPGSIVDLMQRLAYQGMLTYRSLAFYCKRFAIDVPDDVTGADIGALVAAGKWSQVHDHVRADVAKTTALARRIGVLTRADRATTTGPCDGRTVGEGTSPMKTDSTVPALAFPKPFPTQARHAATALSGRMSVDDDTFSIRLLHDVRQVFTDEILGSAALVHRLVVLEDRPWADWAGGRPITQARMARLLRPFGIYPTKLRLRARTANGYTRRMFADPWSRYLPRKVEQRNTVNDDGDERDRFRVEPDTAGSGSETEVTRVRDEACSSVPPVAGETGPTAIGDDGEGSDDPQGG